MTESFSGCLWLKVYINRIIELERIEKLEIAIDFLASNEKQAIISGTTIPPPPTPATELP